MIQKLITKKAVWLAAASLALRLVQNVSAQDNNFDAHWNGTPGNTAWNVAGNWNPVGVPPSLQNGNIFLDAANGDTVMTIPAGDVESPGATGTNATFDTIFGPEFGTTLNIYGTLNFQWFLFPVQNNPAPGLRSYLNLRDHAVVSTSGAAVGIGDSWFYQDAPYVTMNLYSNAQYNSFGGAGLWLGGHLNIYDNASFLANNYINMDTLYSQSDGTRSINIGGGTFKGPEGSDFFYPSWVARGIIRVYGKGQDTEDLVMSDDGTNAIATAVPLGGALVQIYFQPLLKTNVSPGTFQQVELVGDYPSVSGVLLSSSEPGLDPAAIGQPVYTSSNPKVATVDANGMLTAVNPGTATITARLGAFTTTNSVVLTVGSTTTLVHEYKFSETSGTELVDSVPGNSPTWDGALVGGGTLDGSKLTLDGSTGYVQLPAGILSGIDQVTIEAWASFGSTINVWANLFAFGNTDGGTGNGENYINLQPHTGGATASVNFGQGDPGFNGEWDTGVGNTFDGQVNMHIVVVYDPFAGSETLYTNGVFASQNTMFNNMIDPVAYAGPTYNSGSILNYTMGADPLNYIGHSLYNADPTLNGSIDEFRIYSGPLSAGQVAADHALGPDQFIGTSTNVSLTAKISGTNLAINWPTTSALVSLMSSPTLGTSAVWTPVSNSPTTVGGNYQVIMPAPGSARFFRLQ